MIIEQKEYDLILRQVQKLYEHRANITAREQRRKDADFKLLMSIQKKLKSLNMEIRDLKLTRQELRAVQSLCVLGRRALNESLIPGYERRIEEAEKDEQKDFFRGYLTRCKETDTLYSDMLVKVEKDLS